MIENHMCIGSYYGEPEIPGLTGDRSEIEYFPVVHKEAAPPTAANLAWRKRLDDAVERGRR